jgi:hypothetical protein
MFGLKPSEMLTIAIALTLIVGPIIWSVQLAHSSGRSALVWGVAAFLFAPFLLSPVALLILYLFVRNDRRPHRAG